MRKIAFEQPPHARLEAFVMRLAVAFPQPDKDAEDARVALRGERPIGVLDVLLGLRLVARDHRRLDRRAHVAPRVFEHRRKVVGGLADESVLKIEKAGMRARKSTSLTSS